MFQSKTGFLCFFLVSTSAYAQLPQSDCVTNGQQLPLKYCDAIVAQDRNRCLKQGNDYFKQTLCCKSCENALGGAGQAGKYADWKGDACKDEYGPEVCSKVAAGLSIWKCDGAGKKLCRKSCGCTAASRTLAAPCNPNHYCNAMNETIACNAKGQNVFKCDLRTRKCACALTPYCDLAQNPCAKGVDCSSDRRTDLSSKGCKCVNNKCTKASCMVGQKCTGNSPKAEKSCSSDGSSAIEGCVCINNKCDYFQPACLPGKKCIVNTDCTTDSSDGYLMSPKCLCTDIKGEKKCANGTGSTSDQEITPVCNAAELECTGDAECSTGGTILDNCFCDITETVKTCGILKICFYGNPCKVNTDCMTDGSDGSNRSLPCKCDPTTKTCG